MEEVTLSQCELEVRAGRAALLFTMSKESGRDVYSRGMLAPIEGVGQAQPVLLDQADTEAICARLQGIAGMRLRGQWEPEDYFAVAIWQDQIRPDTQNPTGPAPTLGGKRWPQANKTRKEETHEGQYTAFATRKPSAAILPSPPPKGTLCQ
jgi:hypothetical protein